MTLGIQGFSHRIKRKVTDLTREVRQCHGQECPLDNCFCRNLPALAQDVDTMVETTRRLNETLGFLKILTGSTLAPQPRDFHPVLIRAIQDLMELRFPAGGTGAGKHQAGIEGQPAPSGKIRRRYLRLEQAGDRLDLYPGVSPLGS